VCTYDQDESLRSKRYDFVLKDGQITLKDIEPDLETGVTIMPLEKDYPIRGHVYYINPEGKTEPLTSAEVYVQDRADYDVFTDDNGAFTLAMDIEDGEYALDMYSRSVLFPFMNPMKHEFTVKNGRSVQEDISIYASDTHMVKQVNFYTNGDVNELENEMIYGTIQKHLYSDVLGEKIDVRIENGYMIAPVVPDGNYHVSLKYKPEENWQVGGLGMDVVDRQIQSVQNVCISQPSLIIKSSPAKPIELKDINLDAHNGYGCSMVPDGNLIKLYFSYLDFEKDYAGSLSIESKGNPENEYSDGYRFEFKDGYIILKDIQPDPVTGITTIPLKTESVVQPADPNVDRNTNTSSSSKKTGGGGGGGGGRSSKPASSSTLPKIVKEEEIPKGTIANKKMELEQISFAQGTLKLKPYSAKDTINEKLNFLRYDNSTDVVKIEQDVVSDIVRLDTASGEISRVQLEMKVDPKKIKDPEKTVLHMYNEETESWDPIGGFYNEETGTITSSTDKLGYFTAMSVEKDFTDTDESRWAEAPINTLASRGVISGYEDQSFKPNNTITRAEFATILCNAVEVFDKNENIEFTDVDGQWYEDALKRAVTSGFMSGYGGQMRPNDKINHEQMTVMVMNAFKKFNKEAITDVQVTYMDADSISDWALVSVLQADKKGIIINQDTAFKPKDDSTRAEAAVLVYKLLKALELI